MNSFKMAKVFNVVPKWQILAKSGHTAPIQHQPKLVKGKISLKKAPSIITIIVR